MVETANVMDVKTTFKIEEMQLSNGARMLYRHVEGAPRMAVSAYLTGGNLRDPIPGLADVTDRLLMKGTSNRSQEEISETIDGLSLECDIETKRDYSAIHMTLLEEDLDESFDLVSDLFYNATLNDFDREKEKLMGEIQMDLDSPRSRASDNMAKTIFGGSAYSAISSIIQTSLPTMNDVEDLRRFIEDRKQWRNIVNECLTAVE